MTGKQKKTNGYGTRDWVYIGLFGALWGVVELSLGSILHIIFPPLTNTFFAGLIPGMLGCIIALTGRRFVDRKGSLVFIGLITGLLKAFSPGGIRIGPITAIVMQAVLMEGALDLFRGKSIAHIPAGMLALGWNFLHRFIMLRLLYGKRFTDVALKMAKDGSTLLGIPETAIWAVLASLLISSLAAGAAAGLAALRIGRTVEKRMARTHE